MRKAWLFLLALVFLTAAAEAQPYDFVAKGRWLPCGVGVPRADPVLEWVPGGMEFPTDVGVLAAAGNGAVLAAIETTRVQLTFLEPDGTRTPFFSGANGYRVRHMVVNRAGAVYVLATQGFSPPYFLIEISPGGTLQGITPFPYAPVSSVDLAADQCTLFVVTTGAIRRYDVCTRAPLPDFTALTPDQQGTVKVLPNGDVLLADEQFPAHVLLRYDATGTLVRTYTIPELAFSLRAMGLSRDGAAGLLGENCGNRVFEVDLSSGSVIRETAMQRIDSMEYLISSRGFAGAIGPLASTNIPSTSTFGLISLFALLMLAAVRRLA